METIDKYGRFIEDECCYELLNEPPRKWINLNCNKIGDTEYYSEITNIGDGYVSVRDKEGVTCLLINWDSKFLYIRDEETGQVFCPGGAPAPQKVENFSCKYYAEKTVIKGTYDGLTATQRVFVPQDDPLEIWTVKVMNESPKKRKISVFAYAVFQLTGYDREGKYVSKDNYADVVNEIDGVFIKNRNVQVPTDLFNGFLFSVNKMKGADGYRDYFLRSEISSGTPKILYGYDCSNRNGIGPDCAGIVQVSLEIAPSDEGRVDFVLGHAPTKEAVKDIKLKMTPQKIEELCLEKELIEQIRRQSFTIDIGNKDYNGLMNYFVKKQVYNYLINKSGFRDNLQVDYALAMIDYRAAVTNFILALEKSQVLDGSCIHSFRPINRLKYSDKPAWILMTGPALIKESGDFSLLTKLVGYFESDEKSTIWEHMLRAMRYLANDLGKNGLCNQHHADWNDGLEATAEAGERESIMVTQQLCYGLLEMEELACRIGATDIEIEARELYRQFSERLNQVCWDGEWYIRTICEDGYRIGSHQNAEGKIFANTQSWAVLSQVADEERATICMESIDKHIRQDVGYQICNPGFSQYDPRVGRMSNSMPGQVENGGCYNHAAGFKAVADCMLGRVEEAWETFVKVAPGNPLNPIENSWNEPFSFTNYYSTSSYNYGVSGYPWRTGTSAWFVIVMVEWILGARRSYDGLLIDPCLTKKIKRASLIRNFREATYEITIDNTGSEGSGKGVKTIYVDGSIIEGNVLPVFSEGVHQVEVIMF